MRSISAAPDLVAGLKAARVSVVPLLNCSKYRLVSSCNIPSLSSGFREGIGGRREGRGPDMVDGGYGRPWEGGGVTLRVQ